MSNKILEEVKGYKNWIVNNRKGFVISVTGTAVVVSVIGAGFGIIPLNNAKNTAQTEYDKIMTKYRASLVVNADLEQLVATLKGTISNLVDERDGLQQAEQPAEEEVTEEAKEQSNSTNNEDLETRVNNIEEKLDTLIKMISK